MVDNADPNLQEHEIEKLVDKNVRKRRGRGKGQVVKYLIKWKNWGSAHNA